MSTTEFENVNDTCPGAVSRFENFIKTKYKFDDATLTEFKNLIKANGALISGSSVLHSLFPPAETAWKSNDIDIYVQAKNFIPLRDFLVSKCEAYRHPEKFPNTNYGKSFFKMNKIIKMYTFTFDKKTNWGSQYYNTTIDLVMVENSQPLETLIRNYDLSCCMNFYDGEVIKSLNLTDTLSKKSKLSPDYFKMIFDQKIRNRINKYRTRGFQIILPEGGLQSLDSKDPMDQSLSEEEFKKYITSKIFRIISNIEDLSKYQSDEEDEDSDDENEDVYPNKYIPVYYKGYIEQLKTLESIIPKNFPIKPFTHEKKSEYNYNNKILDGVDPYEYDSAEKYKTFGNAYVSIYYKVIETLHNAYEALIEDSEKYTGSKPMKDKTRKFIENYVKPSIAFFGKIIENNPGCFSGIGNVSNSKTKCFDEIEFEEVEISKYLKKKTNIVIKIGDNFKGYDRKNLKEYIEKHKTMYNGQKLDSCALEYIKNNDVRFYEIIQTGLKSDILIPYSNENFVMKFKI
jgi:hypothetical protein